MDRLALRLRLHKMDSLPLEAVNLLHDITPGSTMKSGYLLINDKDCCWHSWVETKDRGAGHQLPSGNFKGSRIWIV